MLLAKINLAEPDEDQPFKLYLDAFKIARELNQYLLYEVLCKVVGQPQVLEHEDAVQADLLRLCKEITNDRNDSSEAHISSASSQQEWLRVITEYRVELEKSLHFPPVSQGQSHALIIGVGNYKYMQTLSRPPVDARDLYGLLSQNGYLTSNLTLLVNDEATKETINNALDDLARNVSNHDTVVLFFSGHGFSRPGGFEPGEYLCPATADWNHLRMTAISNEELTTALKAITARQVVVFLDACHSGGVGEPKDPSLVIERGLSENTYKQLTDVGEGRVVIASCGPNEVSWELQGMRNGLFTHYLLEGLGGAAVSDDGAVRVLDLYNYICREVPKRAPTSQNPLIKASANLNFPIIFPKPSSNA